MGCLPCSQVTHVQAATRPLLPATAACMANRPQKEWAASARTHMPAAATACPYSSQPASHSLVLMAHSGPTGLGAAHQDICGVDWLAAGGDHGDPDLQVGAWGGGAES